jgi:EGF-like domain
VCVCVLFSAEIDPCASNPCQNGNCYSDDDGYTCKCDKGWTGSNCEQRNLFNLFWLIFVWLSCSNAIRLRIVEKIIVLYKKPFRIHHHVQTIVSFKLATPKQILTGEPSGTKLFIQKNLFALCFRKLLYERLHAQCNVDRWISMKLNHVTFGFHYGHFPTFSFGRTSRKIRGNSRAGEIDIHVAACYCFYNKLNATLMWEIFFNI